MKRIATGKNKARQKILVCGASVLAVAFGYGILCLQIIGGEWGRKEGDLPPISPVLQRCGWVALSFPFGYLGVDSILILPVVNGLFWGILTVAIAYMVYARCRKKSKTKL